MSQITFTFAPGVLRKFRIRLGPQYPQPITAIFIGLFFTFFDLLHYGFAVRSLLGGQLPLGDEHTFGFDGEGITLTTAHSSFRADWAQMPVEMMRRALRRFAEEVMPRFS